MVRQAWSAGILAAHRPSGFNKGMSSHLTTRLCVRHELSCSQLLRWWKAGVLTRGTRATSGTRMLSKWHTQNHYPEWFTTFYRYCRSVFLGSFGTENVNYKIGSDWLLSHCRWLKILDYKKNSVIPQKTYKMPNLHFYDCLQYLLQTSFCSSDHSFTKDFQTCPLLPPHI